MLDAFRHQDNLKHTDTFDCRQQVLSPEDNFLFYLMMFQIGNQSKIHRDYTFTTNFILNLA